jgi:hypothetical protein
VPRSVCSMTHSSTTSMSRWASTDPSVVTLDPAAGTGTYLLGVIAHALGRVEAEQGVGAVPGQATSLAANLYGFEIMVGRPWRWLERSVKLSRSV